MDRHNFIHRQFHRLSYYLILTTKKDPATVEILVAGSFCVPTDHRELESMTKSTTIGAVIT
ncbi:hypothetical protein LCO01nite_08300 [Lapidilactobacillus concavus]|nr:hypothetical protein LCO01nite_08300 [Lapidilactobacillus concavus]